MTSEDVLLDALRRFSVDVDRNDVDLYFDSSESGLMAEACRRETNGVLGRAYLDRSSGTVYSVPSGLANAADMDRAVADPDRRARLTVI
jgi:hypothetical protein